MLSCRAAVEDFRRDHGVTEPIVNIDGKGCLEEGKFVRHHLVARRAEALKQGDNTSVVEKSLARANGIELGNRDF